MKFHSRVCTLVGALGIEAVAAIYSSQIAKKRKLHLTPPRKQVCDNHPIPLATHLTPPKKQVYDNHPIPPTVTPSPLSKTKLDDDLEIICEVRTHCSYFQLKDIWNSKTSRNLFNIPEGEDVKEQVSILGVIL